MCVYVCIDLVQISFYVVYIITTTVTGISFRKGMSFQTKTFFRGKESELLKCFAETHLGVGVF